MNDRQVVWKVGAGVRFRQLFDESVLLHPETGQALGTERLQERL